MRKLVLFTSDADLEDFSKICQHYSFDIDVQKDRYVVDAKSILGLLSLDRSKPLYIVTHCKEHEATAFFKEIERFVSNA